MRRNKTTLLFICLGNICRSPAAEGVMRRLVEDAGVADRFVIDSAGIGDWHVGQLPDRRMRACGARRGYDFSSHARQLCRDDFARFDLLLVMDGDNLRAVRSLAPTAEAGRRVRMLIGYAEEHAGATCIPDPYYGSTADFEHALDLIEDACRGLLAHLLAGGE